MTDLLHLVTRVVVQVAEERGVGVQPAGSEWIGAKVGPGQPGGQAIRQGLALAERHGDRTVGFETGGELGGEPGCAHPRRSDDDEQARPFCGRVDRDGKFGIPADERRFAPCVCVARRHGLLPIRPGMVRFANPIGRPRKCATHRRSSRARGPPAGGTPRSYSAYGIRTRVTGVRGQRPRPLDECALDVQRLSLTAWETSWGRRIRTPATGARTRRPTARRSPNGAPSRPRRG